MALISCYECGKPVSTLASSCPNCGAPVVAGADSNDVPPSPSPGPAPTPSPTPLPAPVPAPFVQPLTGPDDEVLYTIRRSFWTLSGHTVSFMVLVPLALYFLPANWWRYIWPAPVIWFLILAGKGLLVRYAFVMRIYRDRISLVEGLWSREISEFFIRDIRSIDVRQGFMGRLVNVGSLVIATAAGVESTEEAHGIRQPDRVRDMLIGLRQKGQR